MNFFFIITLLVLFVGCNYSSSTEEVILHKYQKSFIEEDSINTTNPDRGFFKSTYELNIERNWNAFIDAKKAGYQLLYAPIVLEKYVEIKTLPNSLIQTIEKNLIQAKNAHIKLILRFSYRNSLDSNDPTISIVESHFNQLKPLLQKYKESISIVEAGTIGAWGEWHHFTGEYADTNSHYQENRKLIINKLLEIFPNKYIQIRTPKLKEELFGKDNNSTKNKIAYHDDCFVFDKTDNGTYPSDNIEFWKSYLANDSQLVPIGGETCGIKKGEETLSSCINTLNELQRLHYAFMNVDYHPDVIKKWKDEGCFTEIQEKLGYNFVATNLDIEQSDKNLKIILELKNEGYSRAYIDSNITFSLISTTETYNYVSSYNIRSLLSETNDKIEELIPLSHIKKGSYCLYMKIGDSFNSIKLSNSELWDTQSVSNKLICDLNI